MEARALLIFCGLHWGGRGRGTPKYCGDRFPGDLGGEFCIGLWSLGFGLQVSIGLGATGLHSG